MLQIELEPELEAKLRSAADKENLPADSIVREIVTRWIEDREDYARGIQSLLNTKQTISIEEMEALSDVAD